MTTTDTRSRQPKGAPIGGQFSATERPEAGLELAAADR